MSGRKRKQLSVVPESEGKAKRGSSLSQVRSAIHQEGEVEAKPERSHYFCKEREPRLGEDFFNQPCICLAKALLGKVCFRLQSYNNLNCYNKPMLQDLNY